MSAGILRVLMQSQVINNEQAERYQRILKDQKDIVPMLFDDKVINPKSLAELLARVFSYPLLDLTYYPRSNIVSDVISEDQMQANRP